MNYLETNKLLNDSQYGLDENTLPKWHQQCFVIILRVK